MDTSIDVLMITYNRSEYVARSLPALLDDCDERARVWIWHNGEDQATLEVVQGLLGHPRVVEFHHSAENLGLRAPTNWLWQHARGAFVSKVDDDCLLEAGWTRRLADAHVANPSFGVVAASRILDEEFQPALANRKIRDFEGGHSLLQNLWVQGSGYLMKRQCVDELGPLRPKQTFTQYCIALAQRGYINGWYFPLIHEDHMDDPRSPYTLLRSDEDLQRFGPLSARRNGAGTLKEWDDQLRRSAELLQRASLDTKRYSGWRRAVSAVRRRSERARTGRMW